MNHSQTHIYTYIQRPNTGINSEFISSHITELFEAADEGEKAVLRSDKTNSKVKMFFK